MSELVSPTAPAASGSGGAGAMLRAARQAQGLHIAALAASIKVPQAKLEALEAERFAELPDATFTRALAQSVCRALKVDAAPVLARLPSAGPLALDKVEGGLNTPFRDRPGRSDPIDRLWLRHPITWVVALLLVGAVAVSFVPTDWLRSLSRSAPTAAGGERTGPSDVSATSGPVIALPPSSVAGAIVERIDLPGSAVAGSLSPTAAEAPSQAPAPAASVVPAGTSPLELRATEASWVQVTDSRGKVLFGRLLGVGETAGVDAEPPLKIRIGNARGTEVRLRGQVVDISPSTRDNIANVELR